MRRVLIYTSAFVLYTALLFVTWELGTSQAEKKTEWQLEYGVIDIHDTVVGAIDTMLGHVARTAVRRVGAPGPFTMEGMSAEAKDLDVDEINVVNREGLIVASNDPCCLGVVMAGDPVMDQFMQLTNGVAETVSQPFRPHARNPAFRAKYLAAAFPGGDGFVQVGLDERRLHKMLPSILGYIFDEWLFGRTGFILCADMETGRLVSNPSRHRDKASTLEETGYDAGVAGAYEIVADGSNCGRTFVQTLFGDKCYCRAFVFGGHRLVAALPEREFYDTRTAFVTVFAVLLFAVLASFSCLLDKMLRDASALKEVYESEERRRAKTMEIAKTIQTAALPSALPENPCFRLDAAMQAARDVGGDFYDYFLVDSTHLAFLVADVSGKGISAALYMMTAKTLIKDTLLSERDPAVALTKANAELCRNNPANMFLTAWVGMLDLETGVVVYANAGHNPPCRVNAAEYVQGLSGPVLAFLDGVQYKPRTVRLKPGDTLFLYTDGVTEALDSRNTLFGDDRLADTLKSAGSADPRRVCSAVRAAVAAFAEGVPQADDITVLAVSYVAPPCSVSRSFPPTQEGIAGASAWLDEALGRIGGGGVSPAAMSALHVILDEMCSNIVKHSGASGFNVDIEVTSKPGAVKLTFVDDGVAYDPLGHADPDISESAEKRPIGGLGILMVKKMSDSVSYSRRHNRNCFTVVKNT